MNSTAIKKTLSLHFTSEIRHGIRDLSDYTDKIERYLESVKERIEEKNKKRNRKTEEEKDDADFIAGITSRLGYERHIEIFTKSAIISIYTYLEFFLDDFCMKIHELERKSTSPRDFPGNGIFRSRRYLDKVLFIDFVNLNPQWEKLTNLNKIRNFLVHSNGVLTTEETKVNICKTIKNISGIKLEDDHLEVSPNYIRDILSVIENTLTEIVRQYSKDET
ncbi:MAG: hypothetical protein K2Q45_03820 [Nitrosomonas sp.]|nr:hypothetical protein [Nitrosomonas sp.]